MNISLTFIRTLFTLMCVFFLTAYTTTLSINGFNFANGVIGITLGLLFGGALISLESMIQKANLKSFNLAMIGLFLGYLMAQTIMMILSAVIDLTILPITMETAALIKIAIFLSCAYFGMIMTARCADDFYISIPFVRVKQGAQNKRDIILDSSVLQDSRIIDLAASGLLDYHLVIPRFVLKDLHLLADSVDDTVKSKARRAFDMLKKLESFPTLHSRISEIDYPEAKDITAKIDLLAQHLEANIITADQSRVSQGDNSTVKIINLQLLFNVLKPLTQTGENLIIKIQRYGKEPRQGIGYLDDGTMVVVNGGAEYLGETIRTQILSVKHTTSGRMIFCNALEDSELDSIVLPETLPSLEGTNKNCFSV